ncbi:hypothetical protein As57867_003035, partial [Aphanomyces stellatus]
MDLTAGRLWKVDACIGLMGDPYIGGTELEGGHISNGLLMVSHFLAQVDDDRVKAVSMNLRDAVDLARSKAGDAAEFLTVLESFKEFLASMQVGVPY